MKMNYCRSCDQDFGSVSAFDRHRVGTHDYTYREGVKRDPPVEDGRRCLDLEELERGGIFTRNLSGAWSIEKDLLRVRRLRE